MYSPAVIRKRKWSYYNEIDPFCVQWLRELINESLIAPGIVDPRPIQELQPEDLVGFKQCHFFAGIGGWSYALRLAGVPDDFPVWTGSCPCQPFSVAGKRAGTADERHLWPEMFRLIKACKPERVFGEQVEGAVKHGWLDGVFTDLETKNYSTGAAVLGAHSVGAPHIRQRLYWAACSDSERFEKQSIHLRSGESLQGKADESRLNDGLADLQRQRLEGRQIESAWEELETSERSGDAGGLAHAGRKRGREIRQPDTPQEQNVHDQRLRAWDVYEAIPCLDGKARRIEAGTFPLAHGISNRVGFLRGYGNAIVPQAAAEFIQASLEAIEEVECTPRS